MAAIKRTATIRTGRTRDEHTRYLMLMTEIKLPGGIFISGRYRRIGFTKTVVGMAMKDGKTGCGFERVRN
jgi:hypothetical protein